MNIEKLLDPFCLADALWPDVTFYDKQYEIVKSIWENDETVVPAGNMLGKDFIAGFVVLAFFLTRYPCRIVTTSAKADHLRVLWGEINRFVQTSRIPLTVDKGGPLIVNHHEIKRWHRGNVCPISYIKGMVASPDSMAAMQGHHVANVGDGVPRTLFLSDESSSVPDDYYQMARTWFNRAYIFGNTWPCDNFFKHAVKGKPGTEDRGGDIRSADGKRFYRRVIRIRATDSPNVRLGLAQRAAGLEPTGELLVPGVKSYDEYCKNLATWDAEQKCVSLDAEFYEGASVMMFPREWLDVADVDIPRRRGKWMGVDPAEGKDSTTMVVIDERGVVAVVSCKTPDTNVIVGNIIGTAREYGVPMENVCIDTGGGGKQHADRLRASGYRVRCIGFGEGVSLDIKHGRYPIDSRRELKLDRYAYVNRRAEMYGEARELLDPSTRSGFYLPRRFAELRRQLSLIPLGYDSEGRLKLLPKRRTNPNSKESALIDIIGCSPDEADAMVLAIHGMLHKATVARAGAVA